MPKLRTTEMLRYKLRIENFTAVTVRKKKFSPTQMDYSMACLVSFCVRPATLKNGHACLNYFVIMAPLTSSHCRN